MTALSAHTNAAHASNSALLQGLSVKTKLAVNAGLFIVLFVLFSGWLWQVLGNVRITMEDTLATEVNLALEAQDMQRNVVQVQQFLSDVSATRGLDGLDDGFKLAQEQRDLFVNGVNRFQDVYRKRGDAGQLALAQDMSASFSIYYDTGVAMAQGYVRGGPAEGNRLMARFDEASSTLQEKLAVFVKAHVDAARANVSDVGQHTQNLRWIALAICAAVIVLGTAAAAWIATSIVRPLRSATRAAQAIADGDLTQQVSTSAAQDEVGQLMNAMATMQAQLRATVTKVRDQVEQVSAVSSQLAAANQDLSSRTEEQASALQETSATMDQLGGAVQHNADNARQANALSDSATHVATSCGTMVTQVVAMMSELNASSHRINDIVGVIDGIAFQTNILALNAAVEAARAGEQGRGFAVVASEVRALAGRSSEAAKQIRHLIADSVGRVEGGTALAGQAGSTMADVVTSIQQVNALVDEICVATTEQTTSMSQVGQAVAQMDQATQQNATLVEETARVADGLQAQAAELIHAIAAFRLPGAGHTASNRPLESRRLSLT